MTRAVLMCPPDYFAVVREDNVHMDVSIQPDPALARQQWQTIVGYYAAIGIEVYFLEPDPQLPDQCFTANVAWLYGRQVFLPNFKKRERHLERLIVTRWLSDRRHPLVAEMQYVILGDIPGDIVFEGGGDAASIPGGPVLLGYGQRTHRRSVSQLNKRLTVDVVGLRLIDPRFYHLDTCLLVIPATETILYYPGAFDAESNERIASLPYEALPMDEADAERFVANGVVIGSDVVVNEPTAALARTLAKDGLTLHTVDTSEFMKSGGSVRCLTLPIA